MTAATEGRVRCRIRVRGIVQGVGFRPFVHRVATGLGLTGHVGNDSDGVFIEAEGDAAAVESLVEEVRTRAPALAAVESVDVAPMPPAGDGSFVIVASPAAGVAQTLISPDAATCDDCLRELFDPADRRYRYPFTNCTNCGPRFTIVTGIPYDRPNTTMAGFAMCALCAREYHDPGDRRFHAQPTCCPVCGPRLSLVGADGRGDPVRATAALLRAGAVVAVKGLGGYHLAADAGNEAAVSTLRSRKHREDKPFALMCADLDEVRRICDLSAPEEALLTSRRRPIVLLRRRPGPGVAEPVAPGHRCLGVMLPYTPLHHLLARELGRPFVLTSGNVSDEPIAYGDGDATRRLSRIADAFLVSDRPIHMRADDSVLRVVGGRTLPLRRSRGFAPEPVTLPWTTARPVLGCGAELKNTFCLLRGRHAFVSQHVGDLENYETLRSFREGIAHYERLLAVRPEVVAHDLHPEYLSTKWALERDGVEVVGVQHHHAHIASCLADNGEAGPVLGVAFDGTGYGTDGTLWGGELLVADLASFERAGHLQPSRLPGGVAAIREPWRMAAAYLVSTFGDALPDVDLVERHGDQWGRVLAVARAGVRAPLTTSAGRLFDAVAALAGVRDAVNYEGQAAIELEQCADPAATGAYPVGVDAGPALQLRGTDLVRAVVADLAAGTPAATVAMRFHRGLAAGVVAAVEVLAERNGLRTVALSGGVFQNALLLDLVTHPLQAKGFRVLTHQRVPPNDGGISLGQAVVAAARGGFAVSR